MAAVSALMIDLTSDSESGGAIANGARREVLEASGVSLAEVQPYSNLAAIKLDYNGSFISFCNDTNELSGREDKVRSSRTFTLGERQNLLEERFINNSDDSNGWSDGSILHDDGDDMEDLVVDTALILMTTSSTLLQCPMPISTLLMCIKDQPTLHAMFILALL
jgi:hypothetical protein